jgi:putative transposase
MRSDRAVLAEAGQEGPQAQVDLREVLNAIRYMPRSGAGWRMLPKDLLLRRIVH